MAQDYKREGKRIKDLPAFRFFAVILLGLLSAPFESGSKNPTHLRIPSGNQEGPSTVFLDPWRNAIEAELGGPRSDLLAGSRIFDRDSAHGSFLYRPGFMSSIIAAGMRHKDAVSPLLRVIWRNEFHHSIQPSIAYKSSSFEMIKNGMIECSACHSKFVSPSPRSVSRAYDKHRSQVSSKYRALNFLLVVGDCILVGLQPILVYMSKVGGKFKFSPLSVNFLTEVAKVLFAIVMLLFQVVCYLFYSSLYGLEGRKLEKNPFCQFPHLYRLCHILQAARNNVLLAVPALLYAINNYLKFIMQLYFNPATVKMLTNLKWEALALLPIGISINQLRSLPEGSTALGLPITMIAYVYTLIFVTVPSMASVYNEYALKSQFETSIYLQNLFLYGYGAIFNFLGIVGTAIFKGPSSFNILEEHSKATMFLICNNAAQGILSSFFFKYADTILKKYSSTVATIFTGIASAALFGHTLTMNFILGISIVFISMHQFFSPMAKVKDETQVGKLEMMEAQHPRSKDASFVNMAAGAAEDVNHRTGNDERQPLLPI
ncbi:UDP-sugar transporter protein [Musa troglodytarum]|uniref:UDP-sugar transporter protein n=1 Tax=Musa troglodytarum TaxID=320322 RepID=A0A9E7JHB1_9LILI|nr:UDP-sugar transporter protein [Musa troglodytarum]